jgi:hypothetical protein
MVHNDSDEELAARLDSALRAGLSVNHVDVAALLAGSRRRARRLRSQRVIAMAAAAAMLVAVPVGYEVIRPNPTGLAQPAALLPSALPTLRPSTLRPTASAPPTPLVVDLPPNPVPRKSRLTSTPETSLKVTGSAVYPIPDSLAFTAAELPADLKLDLDVAGAKQPTVSGQGCDPGNPKAARPITGRQWSWVDSSGKMTSTTVNLVVTGWKTGVGRQAFDELVADTGHCVWVDRQTKVDFSSAQSDQSWSGTSITSTDTVLKYGRAVVRLGDVIAGVEVQDAGGTAAAVKLAQRLALASCQHLQASGLAAVQQQS